MRLQTNDNALVTFPWPATVDLHEGDSHKELSDLNLQVIIIDYKIILCFLLFS